MEEEGVEMLREGGIEVELTREKMVAVEADLSRFGEEWDATCPCGGKREID